jgi:hypothetical protein
MKFINLQYSKNPLSKPLEKQSSCKLHPINAMLSVTVKQIKIHQRHVLYLNPCSASCGWACPVTEELQVLETVSIDSVVYTVLYLSPCCASCS